MNDHWGSCWQTDTFRESQTIIQDLLKIIAGLEDQQAMPDTSHKFKVLRAEAFVGHLDRAIAKQLGLDYKGIIA